MEAKNEHRRLAFLHSLNILDTPIEEPYERITRLLCRVLDVPIAAVSLVDKKRQWFKSIQGTPLIEMNRENSFCSHTILQPNLMLVPDARLDDRFKNLKLVQSDPHVVFYAGYPIKLADNINIGTLCVFDTEPRALSNHDVQFLEDISQTAASEMKARLFKDVYDIADMQKEVE